MSRGTESGSGGSKPPSGDGGSASGEARPAPPGGGRRSVGIREVARQAKVSVATVSLVLNDHRRITDETKRRVRGVIERTGYHPNRAARNLREGYCSMISLLMPSIAHVMSDPYFGELMSGICDEAAHLRHEVMIHLAKPEFIRRRRYVELIEQRVVDGVLCAGFGDDFLFLRDFSRHQLPMVVVDNEFPQWDLHYVVGDYHDGAEQVMAYLTQLGHRRIGLIHGSPTVYTSRVVGGVYEAFMRSGAGAGGPTLIADGLFTAEGGVAAAADLLDRAPDLTAIFAGNDKMAFGAMRHLTHRGLRVPEDISVVGFDDLPQAAYANPALTTMHFPLYEVGRLACRQLINLLRGRVDRVQDKLKPQLVVRESVGPARAR